MEKKWLVGLVLVVAVLLGCWFIPVYKGRSVVDLVKEKVEEMLEGRRREIQ